MSSSKKKRPPLFARIFYSRPALTCTAYLLRLVTTMLFATLRIRYTGKENLAASGALIALWHDKLLLAPLVRKVIPKTPLSVVVSKSRDGRLLGAYVNTFSNAKPIYVAHNRRHTSLLEMLSALETGTSILITPDGPKGPKHILKPGTFYIQQKTGAPLLAMRWHASSFWTLNTWDKMQIPKPFSKVEITFETATQTTLATQL